MSTADLQIVTLYEHPTESLSVKEISEATGLDELCIKLSLNNYSPKYRNSQRTSNDEEFTDEDKESVKQTLRYLSQQFDAPHVAFRAAKYIYEEKKGRNDTKGLRHVNVNIALFNQTRAEVERAERIAMSKVIEIPAEHKHLQKITI